MFRRQQVSIVAFVALFGLLAARAAEQGPYTAYVNTDEVYVRSGPGKNYYPTLKLKRGDEVEVYRHDPGGWYAIRPPVGSFSWVSGEFIKPGADGLGQVIGDRVVARVGTQFSDSRDVIQVRLNRGEDIEIVEAKQFNPGPAAQTWYKIAPPSGEFRWIHGAFVSREAPRDEAESNGPRRNLLIEQPDGESQSARDEDYSQAADEDDVALAEHREQATTPAEAGAETTPREPADLDHEDRAPTRVAQRGGKRPERPVESRGERLQREINEIDLELSAMVAEEPSVWNFDDLAARANTAMEQGETAIERGRARLVINKIEKFADIKRRMDAVGQITAHTDRLNRPYARAGQTAPTRDEFDGVGRLARVNTPRQGVPTYALTDSTGAIRYFVTPSPGLNLRHYLGKQIGISGSVGYLPNVNQQNVTARRVTEIGSERTLFR